MKTRHVRVALLAALGGFAGTALAQAPEGGILAADRATIASCIRDSGEQARGCIGAVAVVCARQGGGSREEAEVRCSRREAAVWRERLEMALAALGQRLESGPRSRLAALQRSWEGYAAQKCAFASELQPAARAAVMQAGCELREVALRSLETERLIRQQAGGRDQRPRLER
jgi:hypothetical protein